MEQIGRYQILEELGRGTSGVVYRALDPTIGRIIAIKSIPLDQINDLEQRRIRERILREARSAGALSHPNIVAIYDVLDSGPSAYIFMEYVDGCSLEQLSKRGTAPIRVEFLKVVRQIAEALDYAHRKGIIHRDVKPANIVIAGGRAGSEMLAKMADFGVAKFVSHDMTQHGGVIGTPNYMSPEQIQGTPVSGASDQFSLAVLAYEFLTGKKPFQGENLPALFYQICRQEEEPADKANPKLTATVSKVLQRAMAKKPEDRFALCSEFVGALDFALGECTDVIPAGVTTAAVAPPARTGAETRPIVPGQPAIQKAIAQPATTETGFVLTSKSREPAVEADERAYPEERGWRNKLLLILALCLSLALTVVFIVKMNSGASIPVQILDARTGPSSPPPDDLRDDKKSVPPLDLSAPVAGPPATAAADPLPKPPSPVKPPPKPELAHTFTAKPLIANRSGSVSLLTDPPGAAIRVDDSATCNTPCSLNLRPGRHTLVASLYGFGVSRKIFNIPSDTNILIPLSRSLGVLVVSSDPTGFNLNVDGRASGKTPTTLRLPPGQHLISVWDGTRWHDETVEIQADEVRTRAFRF